MGEVKEATVMPRNGGVVVGIVAQSLLRGTYGYSKSIAQKKGGEGKQRKGSGEGGGTFSGKGKMENSSSLDKNVIQILTDWKQAKTKGLGATH